MMEVYLQVKNFKPFHTSTENNFKTVLQKIQTCSNECSGVLDLLSPACACALPPPTHTHTSSSFITHKLQTASIEMTTGHTSGNNFTLTYL